MASLDTCSGLTEVLIDIFNLSLSQAVVLKCFKTTSIMLVSKHSTAASLVALTPIIMKCFEGLASQTLPTTLDPIQFNSPTWTMLFINLSSAFNSIILSNLITELSDLDINTSLCTWILDSLTNRPQSVRLDNHTSTKHEPSP